MTDRERAIVMAYTGVAMLAGDKLGIFYGYVSEKLGRPMYTHEFIEYDEIIKKLAKDDFYDVVMDADCCSCGDRDWGAGGFYGV